MNARQVTLIKNGKTTVYQSIEEAAPHLGRHPQTIRNFFSRNPGVNTYKANEATLIR